MINLEKKLKEKTNSINDEEKNKILNVLSKFKSPKKKTIEFVGELNLNSKSLEKEEEKFDENAIIKSLEGKIEKYEKYFEFFSELILDLLKNNNPTNENEDIPPKKNHQKIMKSHSFSPKKRMSLTFYMDTKNQPTTTYEDHYFSDRMKNKNHKFGIKNRSINIK